MTFSYMQKNTYYEYYLNFNNTFQHQTILWYVVMITIALNIGWKRWAPTETVAAKNRFDAVF
mgnify:CR=1 FL=1